MNMVMEHSWNDDDGQQGRRSDMPSLGVTVSTTKFNRNSLQSNQFPRWELGDCVSIY